MSFLIQHFSRDPAFGFEALRTAGYSNYGGADVGEVIAICERIPPGNEDAWLREWEKAGERAAAHAKTSLAKGNTVSAKEAYLRASNYYRTAEFYRRENPFEDELSASLASRSADAFYTAMTLTPYFLEKVAIPYEDTTLPGYLLCPDKTGMPRPTIVFNGGFDSTREEAWFALGATALERGFNILAFDGPGQGEAVRKQRLFFRPDWENVITPVMDYALGRREVAKDKVVIFGWSMGGYLVTQAATHEHRAAALVLDDGVLDFSVTFRGNMPAVAMNMVRRRSWDSFLVAMFSLVKRLSTGTRWAFLNAKWTMGLDSEPEVVRRIESYVVADKDVAKVDTPTLVLDAPDDQFLKGQPKLLYDKLQCDKVLAVLKREEGASAHCHVGSFARLNQVIFDFLYDHLSLAEQGQS